MREHHRESNMDRSAPAAAAALVLSAFALLMLPPFSRVAAKAKPAPAEVKNERYVDPIDMNIPALATDKSVRYDYDIVYVRASRAGDGGKTTWAEVSRPHQMDAGADLVLLHPDGSEEVLVVGGKGSATDPVVSFDGQWVYYAFFHDLIDKNTPRGGSDLYKIHLPTRRVVRLTDFGFTPNTGAADWASDFRSDKQPGKEHLEHPLYNLGPCPLPGGKLMFVSNRNGFRPPKNAIPTLQLFIMDDSDNGPGTNLECVGHFNLGCTLHPVVLKDGRVMFSSLESQGMRTGLEWGLWVIRPDGTGWNPIVSAFATEGGAVNSFHFQAQQSDGHIVYVEYYVGSNFGMGTLRRLPVAPPDGYPAFGPGWPQDPRNSPLASGRYDSGALVALRQPFSPYGLESVTRFAHGSDWEAYLSIRGDKASPRVGKFTHPGAAPDNHLLVCYSPGPGHTQNNPQVDGGIYLIKDGRPIDAPAEMRLIKNDPRYNEIWPRAVVPYERIYGVKEPPQLTPLANDGNLSPHLPEGTPFGLVGVSSLYKRETYPYGKVPDGRVTAAYAGGSDSWQGLDAFTSHGNGIRANWANQGADAGLYANGDIHAIRILIMEPTSDVHARRFYNHANERLRILGEITVRKFDNDGKQPTDPDGNPDTSFLAKIPADMPFTFQTLDKRGMVLNMAQTWHQVRPGELRNDCGGCHAHSQQPTPFEKTAAARVDYHLFDLTTATPLLAAKTADQSHRRWDEKDETGLRYEPSVKNVEFHRDIKPILQRSCVACHTQRWAEPAGNLVLDAGLVDASPVGKVDGAYYRLAMDEEAKYGYKPSGWASWGFYNASRYVRKFQSRRSLLVWKVLGERTDGFTNDDHPSESAPGRRDLVEHGRPLDVEKNKGRFDLDYTGSVMPPAEAVAGTYRGPDGSNITVEPLSDEDKRTLVRWIDLGCPIDLDYDPARLERAGYGWMCDETPPTLTVTCPHAGQNPALSRILIGACDGYTGLDDKTLSLTADFAVDDLAPGAELAARLKPLSPGVWQLQLLKPIETLAVAAIMVSVKDRQGNVTRIQRTFWIGPGHPPATGIAH
jgi:hypothetical protein